MKPRRSHVNGTHMGELIKEFKGKPMSDRVPFFVMRGGQVRWFARGTSHSTSLEKVDRNDVKHMGFVMRIGPKRMAIGRESLKFGNSFSEVPVEVVEDIKEHIKGEIDKVQGTGAHKKYEIMHA